MKRKMTDAEQSAEFKKMAKELGADESPDAFDRMLKRIAPGKPAPPPQEEGSAEEINRPLGARVARSCLVRQVKHSLKSDVLSSAPKRTLLACNFLVAATLHFV
jgi:hypothetical protein